MATYSPSKITKDGNTYNFTDANAIPRSGGAVITGYKIARIDDIGEFLLCGGTEWNTGAFVSVAGMNHTNYPSCTQIGAGGQRMTIRPSGDWTWTGSACVVGSDRRIKDEISEISDEILDAWENLEPKQYKLKSDLETDKENAQIHYGWIAQDVESVIKGDRKTEVQNGLFTHEFWEEQEEVSHEETYTEEVETKSGEKQTVTKTRKVIDRPYKAKGDSYGLRYTECLVVECKYLRRCIARLTARIEELEKGNNTK